MISLETKTFTLDGQKMHKIDGFEVWFMTPVGLAMNLDAALDVVRGMNASTMLDIRPVSVAVSFDEGQIVYEVLN